MGRRVIIADDERKICRLLRALVDWESLGFEVIAEARNGGELLELARSLKPDVIITDIRMPGLSGLDILHELRKEDQSIEVLIMSGYREFEYVQSALRGGATDYLLKPLDKRAVEDALRKISERLDTETQKKENEQKIKTVLDETAELLKAQLLDSVLDGRLDRISQAELNDKYQCGFGGDRLYAAAVKIDLTADTSFTDAEDAVGRKFLTLAADELKKSQLSCLCARRSNCIFVLTACDDEQKIESAFYHLIYTLKEYISHISRGHVTVGLVPVEGDEIGEALKKSRQCVLDQVFRGADKILYYQEHGACVKFDEIISSDEQKQLGKAVLEMDESALLTALQGIFQKIYSTGEKYRSGAALREWISSLQDILLESCKGLLSDPDLHNFFRGGGGERNGSLPQLGRIQAGVAK